MKTVPGKLSMTVVYLVLFHGWLGLANAENVKTFPLNTIEGTEAVEVTAKTANLKGRDGLQVKVSPDHKSNEEGGRDNCTYLLVDKGSFRNGVIEVDLAGRPSEGTSAWARGFVGVVFRVSEDKSNPDIS